MSSSDVVVIGGGPSSEVAAGRLADAGLSVTLIEKGLVGGACSYWACMPSKAMLRPGHVLGEARNLPGLKSAAASGLDIETVLASRDRAASNWDDQGQVDWLTEHGVDLIRGQGRIAGDHLVEVVIETGDTMELTAGRAVIVAVGSRPIVPDLDGEDVEIWDNHSLTSAKTVPESLLIVGGGPVGVEMGQAWSRLGAWVTIVESDPRLLPDEEDFAGEDLKRAFSDEGIEVVTATRVVAARSEADRTVVTLSDDREITVSRLASAVGRRPASEHLGLEEVGLAPGEFIEVDDSMRSRSGPEWLYAIGDANGRSLFTHAGKEQARIASDHILGKESGIGPIESAMPRVVFTDPVVAAAGLTRSEAEASGRVVEVRRQSLDQIGAATIWGEQVEGSAQVLIEEGKLVGATITGPSPVADLIFAFQVAIATGAPLDLLRHVVPQYPTFAEVWLELLDA